MARYEHLPIYKAAMELAIYFEKAVRNFSRYNKYTIGADLRNKSRQIACYIMRINSMENKKHALKELVAMIEELKVCIRLCKESRAFYRFNSYMYSSRLTAELSRQAQGWCNYAH